MYIPSHFAFPEGAAAELHDLIEASSFGTLVTTDGPAGGLEAAHLPFVLERNRGPRGTLAGHVARANPIGSSFGHGREVLAIFQGPHGYISPDWYARDGLVPTWNYVAVHAYGTPRVVSDQVLVRRHLETLAATMESGLAPKPPWRLDRVPATTLAGLQRGIVAFEIEISRLEGKRKLSQNRGTADRAGVIDALEARAEPGALALAQTMRALATSPVDGGADHDTGTDGAGAERRPANDG
jgi:transcriptional regulator